MVVKANQRRKVTAQRLAEQEARLIQTLERLSLVGIYAGLLMPLVYARIVSYPFIFLKILYLQVLVGITFPAWIALAIREPRYRLRGSWLLWSLLAWFAAMGVATVTALNPWRAFFGTQERMSGFFTLLHFLAWAVMVASMLQVRLSWRRLLEVQLGIGVLSAGVTVLQLKYPGLVGSTEVLDGERLSGLLGNPIYAAAYQCFNVYFAVALWPKCGTRRRALYGISLGASLTSLVLAGSRGPMLGLVVGLAVVCAVVALMNRQRKRILQIFIGFATVVGAYAAFLVFFAHRPEFAEFWRRHDNLKHFFDFQIDLARARLWHAGWEGFLSRPSLGWGLNGFEFAFDRVYRSEYHTLLNVDDPHNRVLSILSETGIVGLIAYLAVWSTFITSIVQLRRAGVVTTLTSSALIGAAVGHFVQNLFAFDTPVTFLMTFFVLALALGTLPSAKQAPSASVDRVAAIAQWIPGRAIAAVFAAIVLFGSIIPGLAANYARRAGTAVSRRDAAEAIALLGHCQRMATPYREDQVLVATKGFQRLIGLKKLENWTQRVAAMELIEKIATKHFEANHDFTRFRRAYANTLVAVSKLNRDPTMLRRAEKLLRENLERSPTRQIYMFDYAKYLIETEQLMQAAEVLRKAHDLNPAIGEPRWELGKFLWTNLGRPEEGAKLMASAAAGVDRFWPTKAYEWQQFAQAYARSGKLDGFDEVMKAVRSFSKSDRPIEVHLGIARYLENVGFIAQRDEVLRLARERYPDAARIVNPILTGKSRLADLRVRSEVAAKPQSTATIDRNEVIDSGSAVSLARAQQ